MKRRTLLNAMAATPLLPLTAGAGDLRGIPDSANPQSRAAESRHPIELGDTFFLSRTNPIATRDQRELESQLIDALDRPEVKRARAIASERWKFLMGPDIPEEAMVDFEEIMDEFAVRYLMPLLNYDANYPKMLNNINGPAHQWFGMSVPGSRCAGLGENPDNNYASAPIDGSAHFELHGKVLNPPIGDCPINVAGDLIMTDNTDSLDWRDIEFDSDGGFVITIGPEAAQGRHNHLQTVADSRWVYTRDVMIDWNQRLNAYRIYRIDAPSASPISLEAKIKSGAGAIFRQVGECFMYRQLIFGMPENTVDPPIESRGFGGRLAQRVGRVRLNLKDDEAFVITIKPDGAGYHNLVVNDWWLRTINFWDHTSSLNSGQSQHNEDGSYTYVISIRDPGVHNWLDTVGLHQALVLIRFQILPRDSDGQYHCLPQIDGKLVKLDELDSVLGRNIARAGTTERQTQLGIRRVAFDRRFEV